MRGVVCGHNEQHSKIAFSFRLNAPASDLPPQNLVKAQTFALQEKKRLKSKEL
jgi:hypothetical protein